MSDRFELAQEVETIGAIDWEAFTLNGTTYLVLANYYDGSRYNLRSRIYGHSAMSGQFELVQEISTSGASDWEAFTLDGATYLAVANQYDGSTYNLKSRIYRHSAKSGKFELVQEIDTSSAMDWESFTLDGATYLAVANLRAASTYNVKSRIYRHSPVLDRFEMVQEVTTTGAFDWKCFALDGTTYLAVANYYHSTYNVVSHIYRHSAMLGRLS